MSSSARTAGPRTSWRGWPTSSASLVETGPTCWAMPFRSSRSSQAVRQRSKGVRNDQLSHGEWRAARARECFWADGFTAARHSAIAQPRPTTPATATSLRETVVADQGRIRHRGHARRTPSYMGSESVRPSDTTETPDLAAMGDGGEPFGGM